MLIRPPALATKSGAHRIPRAARNAATESDASWLLAAPAITAQRRAGTETSSSTPPSAHGASTSTRAVNAERGVAQRAPSAVATARFDGSTSDSTSFAPARAQRRATRAPTWPSPITHTERPSNESEPNARRQQARIAVSTPRAVNGDGSPEPPRARARPATKLVPEGVRVHARAGGAT